MSVKHKSFTLCCPFTFILFFFYYCLALFIHAFIFLSFLHSLNNHSVVSSLFFHWHLIIPYCLVFVCNKVGFWLCSPWWGSSGLPSPHIAITTTVRTIFNDTFVQKSINNTIKNWFRFEVVLIGAAFKQYFPGVAASDRTRAGSQTDRAGLSCGSFLKS